MTTKEKITHATAKLLREKGYYGTGLSEILKAVGIPKGSLYHHFPKGKDELVIETIRHAAKEQGIVFKNAMKGKGPAENGLKAIIDVIIDDLQKSNFTNGCPIATVSLDIANQNEELRTTCSNMFKFWIDAVTSFLDYKGINDSQSKAERFITYLEGAYLLAKVSKNAKHLKNFKKDIDRLIN